MKLMREYYRKLSTGKSIPYLFEIIKGNQLLFYFGANHSRDPKNKQYPILKKCWRKFLKTPSTAKVVLVEGERRKLTRNERVAVLSGSEGSLITLLARRAHIPVIHPEPPQKKIISALRKKYPESVLQYYYFAGLVDSWRRYKSKPNFSEWITEVMKIQSERLGLRGFTPKRMEAVHRKLFGTKFNIKNLGFFNSIINPNLAKTVINKIARSSSDIRDTQTIQRIKKEWISGKSMFVVYGSGHAFLHEPILKKITKQPI